MGHLFFPERFKIVEAIKPQSSSAATNGDYVSMKNIKQAYVVLQSYGGDAIYATMYEATSTTGAGAAATTSIAYKIWRNAATTSSDTLVALSDSYRAATTTAASQQMLVLQLDPSQLTDTYDCIQVRFGASTGATKFVSALYVLETAYPADQPPTAVSD